MVLFLIIYIQPPVTGLCIKSWFKTKADQNKNICFLAPVSIKKQSGDALKANAVVVEPETITGSLSGGTYINVKRFGIFKKLKYHETVWFL